MPAEGGEPQTVTIDACEPKGRLAVTVPTEDGPWPLEVTMAERDERVELLFTHRLVEPYDASSIGPGWQFYLDMLAAEITGTSFGGAWEDYYPALRDAYAVPTP